jgi:hypothetical protein
LFNVDADEIEPDDVSELISIKTIEMCKVRWRKKCPSLFDYVVTRLDQTGATHSIETTCLVMDKLN